MLPRYRRYWIVVAYLLLMTPLVAGIFAPSTESQSARERRVLATVPPIPRTRGDLHGLPRKLDVFLSDNFGLRREMVRAQSIVAHLWLRSSNEKVLVGRNGTFTYRLDNLVQQSAGLLLREAKIEETANIILDIRNALAARGVKFVFASPPNSATIYPDRLPKWARNRGRRTEYDLIVAALRARGVPTLDLRPALKAARSGGPTYREHDTHWTNRGALAAFNATASAMGHPGWTFDDSVLGTPRAVHGGDLADMLGVGDFVSEQNEALELPAVNLEHLSPPPSGTYQSKSSSGTDGTIMIVGDSFTRDFFSPMVLNHAARYIWSHHLACGFDWNWIEQVQPDEVWWMPTERYILCSQSPKNMPTAARPQS